MLLELEGVTSFYGKTPILQSLDLGVAEGRCLAVLGRNGVGKTTLVRTIMGLTTRMTGKISIAGEDATHKETYERSSAGIGYIPQGRGILPKFSVRENILLGTFARHDKKRVIPDMCLELFPYLAENLDKRAGQLSGGQQQQLSIARALATDPKILLLDEPTEGIQPNIVQEIEATIKRLNQEVGLTLILTEQHIKIARDLAHEFVIMDRGRIEARGDIGELTDELVHEHLTI
ncbi:MAG: urea ABC transporter ATP-binding subunit UrtE [Rhodospirillaceae bacterium]|mgnify:CR=1 FL=1|jgi:urea transport system ATP-binding protein|nr:urea ABC transporter ATP-binding subunit UrtE [Rhodospirillaceae bacterium]MBT4426633.1 urea ABC transporter ATP-binding subunit UrtE [Rhodospirillaceae bacterium]MBT5677365.1 urea ABC transporter ATP-binding subunit UrtE [Rhodospirillaceae bacterium]MBT6830056.1 urea ABC transporter ATP-binding subunit UrtE [Rhodospirillaceae bacterium]MBT7292186.1 urea ABC transporter ATP-binding subunit UrtE [Rhodospirillaceae bacterium]